jgi:hypothetical protein
MANSGLSGPFNLSNTGIDGAILRKSPGAYALGYTRENTFYLGYVGRSDDDVNARLKCHVGLKYPQFKFGYYPSALAAFLKECELYHAFGPAGLDNKVHPCRPNNTNWKCPHCRACD